MHKDTDAVIIGAGVFAPILFPSVHIKDDIILVDNKTNFNTSIPFLVPPKWEESIPIVHNYFKKRGTNFTPPKKKRKKKHKKH